MTPGSGLRLQPLGDVKAVACEGDACLIPGLDAADVAAPAIAAAPAGATPDR